MPSPITRVSEERQLDYGREGIEHLSNRDAVSFRYCGEGE